ncbi:MAG: hypothetical protein AB2687_03440 [Candidatus Thiodiazotropha taylori]
MTVARNSSNNALIEKIKALEEENQYLRSLLQKHGISLTYKTDAPAQTSEQPTSPAAEYSVEKKIAVFRKLFRGRTDVYPVRWSSKNGKSGYSPARANE